MRPGLGVNHFVPLWKVEDLKEDRRERLTELVNNEMKTLESVMEMDTGHGVLHESLRATTQDRMQILENWKAMGQWLWDGGGFIPAEVPADGDCAIWSLLYLQNNDPMMQPGDHEQECQKLRLEIAALWPKVQHDAMWQFLFAKLLKQIQLPQDQPKEPAKVKQEPVQNKKKKRKKIFVDLSSPPRPSHAEKAAEKKGVKVKVVGSQRPAVKPKQSKNNPFEVPPGPKGKKPPQDDMPAEVSSEPQVKKQKTAKKTSTSLKDQLNQVPDLNDPSKKASKARKKKKKTQDALENAESSEEEQQEGRNRSCWKKEPTEGDRLWEVVVTYLSSLDVTFIKHQQYHSVSQDLGQRKCKQWAKYPDLFMNGKLPDCVCCVQMLRTHNFVVEDVQALLKEAQEDSSLSLARRRWQELQKKMATMTFDRPEPEDPEDELLSCTAMVPFVEGNEPKPDESGEQKPTVSEILRQNPFLRLLPLHSNSKRVPVRCLACKTRRPGCWKIMRPKTYQNISAHHKTRWS